MAIKQPYHEGEIEAQKKAKELDIAFMNKGAFQETIPLGALPFVEQQPMVILGSVDEAGKIWASVLTGTPGFLMAHDEHTLVLNTSEPRSADDDPLWENMAQRSNVGMVIIELGSRRRLRVSGKAIKATDRHYAIEVDRAYPNCPKYIQRRQLTIENSSAPKREIYSTYGQLLNDDQKSLISNADTFFVASAHPVQGIDASHRGGHSGFVKLVNENVLRIPDFSGNSMYNTLGNFISYPNAGLAFIDFENNRVLQLSGLAEILWSHEDPIEETGGTQRYWQFTITGWRESKLALEFKWQFIDYSPHIPQAKSSTQKSNNLLLEVTKITQETDQIKSFQFSTVDGSLLPKFHAGAHLPIKIMLDNGNSELRHYSLLSNPMDRNCYEIGVLLETDGRGGSRYLHQKIDIGTVIETNSPKNGFSLFNNAKHTILIAGGIGITPMLSMLYELTDKQLSYEIHYSAKTLDSLAFREQIESIAGENAHFYVSRNSESSRLDLSNLLSTANPEAHIYVCGPYRLIDAVRDIASVQGWPSNQIHFESFGNPHAVDDQPIEVYLAKSQKTITVNAQQTILDSLLDAGLKIPSDCKRGECGLCVTKVLHGEPDHRDLYLTTEEKKDNICICVSRAKDNKLTLDL